MHEDKRSDNCRVYDVHIETEFFDPGQIAHGIRSLGLLILPAVNQIYCLCKIQNYYLHWRRCSFEGVEIGWPSFTYIFAQCNASWVDIWSQWNKLNIMFKNISVWWTCRHPAREWDLKEIIQFLIFANTENINDQVQRRAVNNAPGRVNSSDNLSSAVTRVLVSGLSAAVKHCTISEVAIVKDWGMIYWY